MWNHLLHTSSLPSKIYARRELTTIRDLQCSIRLILVTFYVWIFYIRLVGIICPKYSEFPQNLSLHFYYYWQHCILFLHRPKGTILCWLWALCVPYHLTKLTQFLQSTYWSFLTIRESDCSYSISYVKNCIKFLTPSLFPN